MKNTFGNNVSVTLFGESHGECIGAVLDGMAAGIPVDKEYISDMLLLRRPYGKISTPRSEKDEFKIVSGVFNGKTTGTPICILIPNTDTQSGDYSAFQSVARPSHADYTAFVKYSGFEDYRGGGHFSGRVTAALVAVGAIARSALKAKNIEIGTHIKMCGGVYDRDFNDLNEDIKSLEKMQFACLDTQAAKNMQKEIESAAADNDSIGGILECAVTGMPAGAGEPWFDTVEGMLSHAMFSIPAVKGVEFGDGFAVCDKKGSKANDEFIIKDGRICTATNSNGGINGGITNGMPIIFRLAVKPTPTIAKPQNTVNFKTNTETVLTAVGRHDPCIVHRARAVCDAVCAITICDILSTHFGTDWLGL